MTEYLVLIDCRNDKTGMRYEPGAVVSNDDFTQAVIKDWLEIMPPVLTLLETAEEEE